jgi:HSP20 family protein
MADTNLERRQEERDRGLEKRSQGTGLFRERGLPSLFNRYPDDWFSMNPFSMMRRFSDDIDRMFTGWGRTGAQENGGWAPPIEVHEKDGTLTVSAELPGLDKDNVKVEVTDNALVIQGERKREWEHAEQGVHRSERFYGSFYRAIPLPDGASAENAKAEFRNGILEIRVPVAQSKQKNRQIPIETGGERKSVGTETSKQAQASRAG